MRQSVSLVLPTLARHKREALRAGARYLPHPTRGKLPSHAWSVQELHVCVGSTRDTASLPEAAPLVTMCSTGRSCALPGTCTRHDCPERPYLLLLRTNDRWSAYRRWYVYHRLGTSDLGCQISGNSKFKSPFS